MASTLRPRFFSQPLKFFHWASIEKPAIFWSCIIGSLGPISIIVVPPVRRLVGDNQRPPIPLTYPIPPGPRKPLEGFDDE
ncbi:NADH-ubiquinone oxidoreductase [Erysiphe necator]|nr:NADH-ubiquinone oxidoreductase [Erysiphe necator]